MTGVWRSEEFQLAMAKEAAYGYKTGTTEWVPGDITKPIGLLRGYDLPDPEQEWIEKRKLGAANSRLTEQLIAGKMSLNGNIPYVMQNAAMFAYALGDEAYSLGVHTIKPSKSLPSFALRATRLNGGAGLDHHRIFSGTKVDQFSFGADDSGELKASMSVISQNVTVDSTTAAPSFTGFDEEPYWFKDSSITMWGTTIGRLQDFEWTISNNLKPKRYFKSAPANTLSELLEGMQTFDIKATITVDDGSIYTQLLNKTPFDVTLEFERDTSDTLLISSDISLAGVVGGSNAMCQIIKAPHSVPEDDEVNVSVEIKVKNMYVVAEDDFGSAYLA